MARIAQTDELLSIEADPLFAVFRWDGPRWRHELFLGDRRLASSVEWEQGRDDPTRVVSPAFQQLSHQEGPRGPRVLLVGQWGNHHCSGVFNFEEGSSGVSIGVDVAVRSRGSLVAMASTYTVELVASDLVEAGPTGVLWRVESPAAGLLRFEAEPPASVSLAEAGRCATCLQARAPIDESALTHRLVYRWHWLDS
jgi:hypothetical protein